MSVVKASDGRFARRPTASGVIGVRLKNAAEALEIESVEHWRMRRELAIARSDNMPTIFSHAIAASAAGQWWRRMPSAFWWWTAICAMLPDADVIGFSFGIRYDDMFGHRGFTHSIFFAAVTAIVVAMIVTRSGSNTGSVGVGSWRLEVGGLFVWFMAVTLSHGLLDAMTNGGRGIGFFAPFSNERFFFPWRPIQVSPIGAGFFSARGLRVLVSECGWIWLPSAIMAASARLFKKG